MNRDRIYRQYRDDALAKQITASEYTTFVAMPFDERFSYRSRDIYTDAIQAAIKQANQRCVTPRKFAVAKRVDDHPGTARVITEEIIVQILESHMFIADLSYENAGVLLEVGIALGLKANAQIILITQGKLSDLHFDIRNNNVISYNPKDSVDSIAAAFIAAASAFESDKDKYISSITRALTPDAIACLKHYGQIQQGTNSAPSLHTAIASQIFPDGRENKRFDAGTRDLLHAKLIWTDWKVQAIHGQDAFGMHATDLGWAVINCLWKLTRPCT